LATPSKTLAWQRKTKSLMSYHFPGTRTPESGILGLVQRPNRFRIWSSCEGWWKEVTVPNPVSGNPVSEQGGVHARVEQRVGPNGTTWKWNKMSTFGEIHPEFDKMSTFGKRSPLRF